MKKLRKGDLVWYDNTLVYYTHDNEKGEHIFVSPHGNIYSLTNEQLINGSSKRVKLSSRWFTLR